MSCKILPSAIGDQEGGHAEVAGGQGEGQEGGGDLGEGGLAVDAVAQGADLRGRELTSSYKTSYVCPIVYHVYFNVDITLSCRNYDS